MKIQNTLFKTVGLFQSFQSIVYLLSSLHMCVPEMPESGVPGVPLVPPICGMSVKAITTRGQIMPTTLLLAHPDLNTQWHL